MFKLLEKVSKFKSFKMRAWIISVTHHTFGLHTPKVEDFCVKIVWIFIMRTKYKYTALFMVQEVMNILDDLKEVDSFKYQDCPENHI
uniref:Uncharacterized protein n=1 Tax=Arion vulgaris TaxID=1028688 RepID=A0A0B6ZJB0_9EUPU